MKNVLVTGGCGFIGSNFVKHLVSCSDFYPVILDKLTYAGNIKNLDQVDKKKYALIEGDICDISLVNDLFSKYKFNGVFNFAAESHVDRSIDGPKAFVETNIFGTFNLLEASRNYLNNTSHELKFIHVSTDEVYGDLDAAGFFTESSSYKPSSPYSASKAASDHLVKAWGHTYDLPIIITNCSNNYGPFQFPEKLIPLMIINCLEWKPLPIYGDGKNERDWLYVSDHCKSLEIVFRNGKIGNTYNIGGNNVIKNIDIVNAICDMLDYLKPSNKGSYRQLISYVEDRPGHDRRYAVDSKKIKRELNWMPKESFSSGIKNTIIWYINNENWWRDIQKSNYSQKRLGINT